MAESYLFFPFQFISPFIISHTISAGLISINTSLNKALCIIPDGTQENMHLSWMHYALALKLLLNMQFHIYIITYILSCRSFVLCKYFKRFLDLCSLDWPGIHIQTSTQHWIWKEHVRRSLLQVNTYTLQMKQVLRLI